MMGPPPFPECSIAANFAWMYGADALDISSRLGFSADSSRITFSMYSNGVIPLPTISSRDLAVGETCLFFEPGLRPPVLSLTRDIQISV